MLFCTLANLEQDEKINDITNSAGKNLIKRVKLRVLRKYEGKILVYPKVLVNENIKPSIKEGFTVLL